VIEAYLGREDDEASVDAAAGAAAGAAR
jgi:hypothetical protein